MALFRRWNQSNINIISWIGWKRWKTKVDIKDTVPVTVLLSLQIAPSSRCRNSRLGSPKSIASSSSSKFANVTCIKPLPPANFFLLKYGKAVVHMEALLTTMFQCSPDIWLLACDFITSVNWSLEISTSSGWATISGSLSSPCCCRLSCIACSMAVSSVNPKGLKI